MPTNDEVKDWGDETTLGRRVFNHNFRMLGREASGWTLLKAAPMHADGELIETTYLWQSNEAPGRSQISVNLAELADWRSAHKHLQAMLAHCMRPDQPRAGGALARIGDVALVAAEPRSDVPAAIRFARGNVAIAVASVGSATVDVSAMARVVDVLLSDPPAKPASLRARATRRGSGVVRIAGDTSPIVPSIKEFGDVWLKVIVPDGELRRSGDQIVYLTPDPGDKPVEIYTIGLDAPPRSRAR